MLRGQVMKKILSTIIIIICFFMSVEKCFSAVSFDEKKQQIIALYNSNNLDEAYRMISSITEEERDYELWYLLGNITQDLGNEVNAVFFLQKSLILNPKFDKAHYNLGNIYFKEKKYNMALNEYKSAIKYKKDFAYYYYNLACAYIALNEYGKAQSELKKAIKLKSDDCNFYYNLAYAYQNDKKEEEAQKYFDLYKKLKTKEET